MENADLTRRAKEPNDESLKDRTLEVCVIDNYTHKLQIPIIVITPPANTSLQSFPIEVLGEILTFLQPRDRLSCQQVSQRFQHVVEFYYKRMQRTKLYKLYIERIAVDSLLIKVQPKEDSDFCSFEIEIEGGNICIETANGEENGLFEPSYRGVVTDKIIQIFEEDPDMVLNRCLDPILKWANFEVIELDDVFNLTVHELATLLRDHECKADKIVYQKREGWDMTEGEMISSWRPSAAKMLKLIESSDCHEFHSQNWQPGNEFWNSPILKKIRIVDEGNFFAKDDILDDTEITQRDHPNTIIDWPNFFGGSTCRDILQQWQKHEKDILEFSVKLDGDGIISSVIGLTPDDNYDYRSSCLVFHRTATDSKPAGSLSVAFDYDDKLDKGMIIFRLNV